MLKKIHNKKLFIAYFCWFNQFVDKDIAFINKLITNLIINYVIKN